MDKPLVAFKGAIRLNNKRPPERLVVDQNSGFVELSDALNCVINEDNSVELAPGFGYLSRVATHSSFVFEDRCFFVQGTELRYLTPSLVATVLRSGLTPDLPMTYTPFGPRVFYINGVESGFIYGDVNYPWTYSKSTAPAIDRVSEAMPLGHLVSSFKGFLLVAVNDTIHASEEWNPFACYIGENYHQLPGKILLAAECGPNLVLGDEKSLYLVSDPFGQYVITKLLDKPPLTWKFEKVFNFRDLGAGVVVLVETGLCFISEQGQLVQLTESHYNMPTVVSAGLCATEEFIYAPTL